MKQVHMGRDLCVERHSHRQKMQAQRGLGETSHPPDFAGAFHWVNPAERQLAVGPGNAVRSD